MKLPCAFCFLLLLAAGRLSAAGLDALVEPGAKPEKLATHFKFTEGPVWSAEGFWLFSDIPASIIYRCTPGAEVTIFRAPSGQANGNAFDQEGRLVTCEHAARRVSRTERDGRVTALAERFEGRRFNSPNDLAIRSDGSIYFTDPDFGTPPGEPHEIGFNGVFRIAPNGAVTLLVRDFPKPNGIAFSPDEKRLYINDSVQRTIRVFDVQADGSLENGRQFAELREPGKEGVPDGMKVDAAGNVWCTGPGGLWVFAPDGALLGKIAVPEVPANFCFGGPDGRTLFITARSSVYALRVKTKGAR